MAIPNPDVDELKELFEQVSKEWGLKTMESKLLMQGIEKNKFKQSA